VYRQAAGTGAGGRWRGALGVSARVRRPDGVRPKPRCKPVGYARAIQPAVSARWKQPGLGKHWSRARCPALSPGGAGLEDSSGSPVTTAPGMYWAAGWTLANSRSCPPEASIDPGGPSCGTAGARARVAPWRGGSFNRLGTTPPRPGVRVAVWRRRASLEQCTGCSSAPPATSPAWAGRCLKPMSQLLNGSGLLTHHAEARSWRGY